MGGVLFVLSSVALVSSGFSTAPTDPASLIAKFPSIRTSVGIAETLDLVAVVLWVILFMSLYWALRETSPSSAIFGSVIGVLGLVGLLAGAATFIAFDPISQLYNAAGATPTTQASLVIAWQATQGVFNETDTVGFTLMSIGFITLGLGMFRAPSFGKVFSGASVVIGLLGLVGIALFSVTATDFALFGILVFVVLPILLGWKAFSLSRRA